MMPEIVAQHSGQAERNRALAAVAELAGPGLVERMRLDAAERVLVMARRLLALAPREAAQGPGASLVLRIARSWDPHVTTAAEHVESLSPAELDAFLAAASRWATGVRDASCGSARRAA